MSTQSEAILLLSGMAAVGQVLGYVLSKVLRRFHRGPWVWAVTAGAAFSIQWYLFWSIPARRQAEAGHPACGAAGALLILGMVVLGPANGIIGALLQWLGAYVVRRRAAG
jgi:hypothetical protein